ncbi:DUF1254 domain-containing protein [Piscinibacter gummiphilus]|uniref:Carboxylesterase n=1 Tax=Piscinibacter gummiphilus TaxID=946333 RepID=A0A1W6LBQ0_9BURK|nr:DUF1254 domain-containing protein [Piscinibacter gummiphilus]ARN21676.1 carboxylesterase [Piscinibacter gummiphilus]ATU66365.1 carboxylesterase [Piscinibacter gummiphilus]GLS95754.1 hypothetical protein GCM10007918_30460 [Piscinibacter gummiphilus]
MRTPWIAGLAAALALPAFAQPAPQKVDVDNFVRAESDMYIGNMAKEGGLGKLLHRRQPASIDNQTVIRLNRDTLYTFAVFDLDAGPVEITMPDAGGRFMSLQVVNQDHYTPAVYYGAGRRQLTRENVGTRYVVAGIRTLVNPADPKDIAEVHALQDRITVSQKATGSLDMPAWDAGSHKKVRDALLSLAATQPDFREAFGTREAVNPIHHLLGTAAGWGGNPDKDAVYLSVTPERNDGRTVYRLDVKDVPVDGFWSVSVYNAKGYYEKNAAGAYTVNNITAKKAADGSVPIQFGGCDGKVANCIPTVDGWNYTVRLYRPKQAVLDKQWQFPAPRPVN